MIRSRVPEGLDGFHFRSAMTILNGRLFILAHDWDRLSEQERREAAMSAFEQSQLLITLYNALGGDEEEAL